MNKNDKIFVAGHTGLIGTALVARLKAEGYDNIITRASSELDLTDQALVEKFFLAERPAYVFLLAAKVGGITANREKPAGFIYPNLMIECNVLNSAWKVDVKKLFYLSCSIIYPKECEQPMKEEYLLTGKPEPTSMAHTIAKIAGTVLCQSYNKQYNTNFICGVAANVYGTNDDFDPANGHVIPGLLTKMHNAKVNNEPSITAWGTGKPERDFVYVDDVADACIFLMNNYMSSEIINIGSGTGVSIGELSNLICEVVGYKGKIVWDTTKPDGAMKKMLDSTKLNSLGWQPKTVLRQGLEKTYRWWREIYLK
ncbi:MAG: GDP-L-fucose synthase [Elusimicrobiota bacterium]